MLLKMTDSDHLIEVLRIEELLDPTQAAFTWRLNICEEMPEPDRFAKQNVCFPSGEPLPRCWRDVHYRDGELERGE